ncbi:hypothetical protein J6590_067878 [Homalodisca vitripennis]|nr:hypothetical protein J6590_067878 [Homalodisca vitripennis]
MKKLYINHFDLTSYRESTNRKCPLKSLRVSVTPSTPPREKRNTFLECQLEVPKFKSDHLSAPEDKAACEQACVLACERASGVHGRIGGSARQMSVALSKFRAPPQLYSLLSTKYSTPYNRPCQ